MRFVKQSGRKSPKVSLILLDWSVRESFHLLHYLGRQSVDREQFEVVFLEYYSRVAGPLEQFSEQVDTWLLLEMPESCITHKHLMYNCGIVFCHGEIVVLCDSDAMVKENFIQNIVDGFAVQDRIVVHLDQFRNVRRDLYPFNYPSFEDVLGQGCINNIGGKTAGIRDRIDPLHSRNYSACMCARRADVISIGGADEHIDYLGNICGPYEMTFRLLNRGFKEVWHENEFLYHTWHPGQDGADSYQGPHDGRQMSRTALEALITKRVHPLVENRAIRLLRTGEKLTPESIEDHLIDERYFGDWDRSRAAVRQANVRDGVEKIFTDLYRGFKITNDDGRYYAWRLMDAGYRKAGGDGSQVILESKSVEEIIQKIDESYPSFLRLSEQVNAAYSSLSLVIWAVVMPVIGTLRSLRKRFGRRPHGSQPPAPPSGESRRSLFRALQRVWQQYRVGWLAAKEHRAYMDRWANHLIANLFFADRGAVLGDSADPPLLLTTSLFIQLYLKALMAFRILPVLRIKRLNNSAKIKQYFDTLTDGGAPKRLMVARNIYTGYYGLIQARPNLKELLVF